MPNGRRRDDIVLGAVAEIMLEERDARTAADRALEHRLDEYGNVIERRLGELEARTSPGAPGPAGPPGAAGPAGPPGAPWRHRRHYDEAENYRAGDVVAQDGGSSIALVDDPGPCPGDGWAALTLRGKPGQRGERGPAGERPSSLSIDAGELVLAWPDGYALRCRLVNLEGLELAA